jgi:hypothetical protein
VPALTSPGDCLRLDLDEHVGVDEARDLDQGRRRPDVAKEVDVRLSDLL